MGEGKRRCRSAPRDKGAGGVHKQAVHIPTGVTYVTEKHFFPRQRGRDTPDTVYHQTGGWQERRVRECAGLGEAEGWCLEK